MNTQPQTERRKNPRPVIDYRARDIKFWRDAAERKRLAGDTACAISFDNMAWLLEHPEGFHAWLTSEETAATRGQEELK